MKGIRLNWICEVSYQLITFTPWLIILNNQFPTQEIAPREKRPKLAKIALVPLRPLGQVRPSLTPPRPPTVMSVVQIA